MSKTKQIDQSHNFSIALALRSGWLTFKKYWLFILLIEFAVLSLLAAVGWMFGQTDSYEIVQVLLATWLSAGVIGIFLQLTRDKKAVYDDLFTYWRSIVPLLIVSILRSVAIVFGLLLFIIPGIVFAAALSLAQFYVIDQKLGPIEALRQSYHHTRGHWLRLVGYFVVIGLINVGGLLLLGVGLLITVPVTMMATIHIYRELK